MSEEAGKPRPSGRGAVTTETPNDDKAVKLYLTRTPFLDKMIIVVFTGLEVVAVVAIAIRMWTQ